MNSTRHDASEGRRFFPGFVAGLLAAISVTAAFATPDEDVQWGDWATVPAPEGSTFLRLADGRRIDAVWEWNDKGNGNYVLKEAFGTERERKFTLAAGDTLEATLYHTPATAMTLTSIDLELLLIWPEDEGVAMRAMAQTTTSLFPREPAEPAVTKPFRLTVPSVIDETVRSGNHYWSLLLIFKPQTYGGPSLSLDVDFPVVDHDATTDKD